MLMMLMTGDVSHILETGSAEAVDSRAAFGARVWLLVSDHPDKRAWPSLPWPDEATVIGEVRWLRRSFA